LIWGAFTGSNWVPSFLHAPGPFIGTTEFTYTARTPDGQSDDATVTVNVFSKGGSEAVPEVEPGDGWAKNDAASIGAWRSGLIRVDANDAFGRDAGAEIVAVDGKPIMPGGEVFVRDGR